MKAIAPDLAGINATLSGEAKTPVSLFKDPRLPEGTLIIVSRWQPSEEERALLIAGEDIYIAQLSDNENVQTINVFIDPSPFKVGAPLPDATGEPGEVEPTVGPHNTVPADSEGGE